MHHVNVKVYMYTIGWHIKANTQRLSLRRFSGPPKCKETLLLRLRRNKGQITEIVNKLFVHIYIAKYFGIMYLAIYQIPTYSCTPSDMHRKLNLALCLCLCIPSALKVLENGALYYVYTYI